MIIRTQREEEPADRGARNADGGFTLPEVIVAVAVVVFGIVGGLTLINVALNSVQVFRNRSVAVASMQEAFEVVRAMRDNNWHADRDWDEFINGDAQGCYNIATNRAEYVVDATKLDQAFMNPGAVLQCSSEWDSTTALHRTPAGRFTHDANGNTPIENDLRRRVFLFPDPPACASTPGIVCTSLDIRVEVQHRSGGRTREIQGEDRLFNWLR